MRKLLFLIPLTLLVAQDRPIPVDNEYAKVIVATTKSGPKGALHKHDMNRVMIYLTKGAQTIVQENGSSRVITATPGYVEFDPKGGMHTSQNTGGTELKLIEIELKKPGGKVTFPKDDFVKIAPKNYKVEIDNDQVRVVRVRLAPHEKIAEHEHILQRVMVALTDVAQEVTTPDGAAKTSPAKAGDVVPGGPARHREQNTLDKPVEYLIVEFKG